MSLLSSIIRFYADDSGLYQDDNMLIHSAFGVTEWFNEYENDQISTREWWCSSPQAEFPRLEESVEANVLKRKAEIR